VVQIVLWYLDSGCLKHMTGNRSQLMNFVSKFLGTVRFGNDHIARIMGYGDHQLGNVTISRVYYVEGLGHNLFSVGQFCDTDLELAKDGLARGIPRLKFQKDHLCSACALGKSKKSSHQPKAKDTNEEKLYLLHIDLCGRMLVASINGKKSDAKADIGIFVGYAPAKKAFRIYNKRTQKIIETIHVTFDELTAMASKQSSLRPGLHSMTPATSSSGLIPNSKLFAAPRAVVLADSLVSTSIDHDAPSTSIPLTQEQEHSPNISQGFEESPKTQTFCDDPLHKSFNEDLTSQGSSSNVRQTHTQFEHLGQPITCVQAKKGTLQSQTSTTCMVRHAVKLLISQHFSKGAVDPTLFTWKAGNDLLLFLKSREKSKVDEDLQGKPVDATLYCGMIGPLMYLTSTTSEADHAGLSRPLDVVHQRSAQFLSDKLVSWSSKKQKFTAISSTEAEYIALSGCCAQILWMRSQLIDYGFQFNKIPLYCDNKSAIALCYNNVQHSRAKHIDVHIHFKKESI
ncbi:uncharacterized mitochondrial protein-like protein, partial [Tanacetum coccineum]